MNQTILSLKQSELLENLIVKYGQIVSFRQILQETKSLWDYQQTKNQVTKLVRNGWLVRIKRGLYVISDLSSRGFLSQSPYVLANLLEPVSYVSFELALQHYGMFDQLTGKTVSISLKEHKPVKLAGVEYRFIKTKPRFYFGWQEVTISNQDARIATPEKALVDMVNYHKSEYAIDLVIEKLADYKTQLDLARLNDYISKFSSTTIKIFGVIFDLLGLDSSNLFAFVKPGSTHWMLPGDTKFNAKWRLYYQADFDKYQVK